MNVKEEAVIPVNHRSQIDLSEETVGSFIASLQSGTPILESIYNALKARDNGRWDGIGYKLTNGNVMSSNWIRQTPNAWGLTAEEVLPGRGDFIAENIKELIVSAEKFVDITTLATFPDGFFKEEIIAGLVELANSGREVTVRILAGWPINLLSGQNQREFLTDIIEPLKTISGGKLKIYVGAERRNPFSWNHSKMVAIDGNKAILGGENFYAADYLGDAPVHDLNLFLEGPYVYYMHQFADKIWESVCQYSSKRWKSVYWESNAQIITEACLSNVDLTCGPSIGDLSILGTGRFAGLVNENDPYIENPADAAMLLAIDACQSEIRISQQDLGFNGVYWKPFMERIAKALIAEKDVYIVLTNDNAKAGHDTKYSYGAVESVAKKIKSWVKDEPNAPLGNDLINLLCSKLHLSTLRFGSSESWTNGYKFANHAKFFMVDDKVFYVGSENLYSTNLMEYGVFISDPVAVQQIRTDYWDPLWNYSKEVAISGSDAPECYFAD